MRFITLVVFSNFIIFVASDATTAGTITTTDPCADYEPATTEAGGYECPSGWEPFVRSMGHWCIRVIPGVLNRYDAESACEAAGAVLSGIENAAEQQYIITQGEAIVRAIAPAGAYVQGALWVGAQRIQACADLNENATGCNPWANNAYHWTDGFTTSKSMMVWTPGQPDYYLRAEYCVQMAIALSTVGAGGAVTGDLDDISCTNSNSIAMINYIRGYVCGKQATPIYS